MPRTTKVDLAPPSFPCDNRAMARNAHPLSAPLSFREMRNRVQNAILLAGLTMLVSYPMFYYQFARLTGRLFARPPYAAELQFLALGQALILFALSLVCALVGFIYSERLGLPGFGRPRDLGRWLPLGLGLGLLYAPASFFLLDRDLAALASEFRPSPWPFALARLVGTALSQEVVARFGLLIIAMYLLRRFKLSRRTWPAILALSAFVTCGSWLFLARLELLPLLSAPQLALMLASTFALNWALSEVFLRYGLIAGISMHLGLNFKTLIYSFWL